VSPLLKPKRKGKSPSHFFKLFFYVFNHTLEANLEKKELFELAELLKLDPLPTGPSDALRKKGMPSLLDQQRAILAAQEKEIKALRAGKGGPASHRLNLFSDFLDTKKRDGDVIVDYL
jgi:hypothetical protein